VLRFFSGEKVRRQEVYGPPAPAQPMH